MNTNQRNTISGAEDQLHPDQQVQSEPITPVPNDDGYAQRSSPKKPSNKSRPDKKRRRSAKAATPNSSSSSSSPSPSKKAKRIDREEWHPTYFSDPTIHCLTKTELEAGALHSLKLGQGNPKHFVMILGDPLASRDLVGYFRLPFEKCWGRGRQLIKSTPFAKDYGGYEYQNPITGEKVVFDCYRHFECPESSCRAEIRMFLKKKERIQYFAIVVLESHTCPDSVELRHPPSCDSPRSPSSPQCDLSSAISPSLMTSLDLDDVSRTADSSACTTPLYSTPRSPPLPNSPQPIRDALPSPFTCNTTSFNVALPPNSPVNAESVPIDPEHLSPSLEAQFVRPCEQYSAPPPPACLSSVSTAEPELTSQPRLETEDEQLASTTSLPSDPSMAQSPMFDLEDKLPSPYDQESYMADELSTWSDLLRTEESASGVPISASMVPEIRH